ncbi:hypothetical protein GOV12_01125 [Candidatus Pacearchaeota archaeon]|nr:hypothetical protein [Candidatus Pacearchaeota archaeon]
MIGLFWIYFIGTAIVMRTITPPFHFKNKTITQQLRKRTGKNIHHLHIGFIFAIIAGFLIIIKGLNRPLLFFAAMALSFIADEIFIMSDFSDYFKKEGLLMSILGHVTIGFIATALLLLID